MWRAFFRAVRRGEHRVASLTWIALAGTILYTVWPIDLIPDVVPIVGLLDDLGLWGVMVMLATRERQRWVAQLKDSAVNIGPKD
jgi:uncharacterized membrane protein YkvA (DUF1232 family)